MTLKEFFKIFESNELFQSYATKYFGKPSDEKYESDTFDWSMNFDGLAIHLSDEEFRNLFEQIEQSIKEEQREAFFDNFNRLIVNTGYLKKFNEEQVSGFQGEMSFDELETHIGSGRRISWLCDWVVNQNSALSSKNVLEDGIEPIFEWLGETKKFTELILFLQINGWIRIPDNLSTNNTKLGRHFARLVSFPKADEKTLAGNITDYIKPFNFKRKISLNTFNQSERFSLNSLSFSHIEENTLKS